MKPLKILILLFLLLVNYPIFAREKPILVPKPKKVLWGEKKFEISAKSLLILTAKSSSIILQLKEFLLKTGIANIDINNNLNLQYSTVIIFGNPTDNPLSSEYNQINKEILDEEGYGLVVKELQNRLFIGCFGKTDRGEFYAIQTLYQLIYKIENKIFIPEVKILDYPSWRIRGVVEGSYAKPWTHTQRMKMFEFIAKYKMNAFFYGPKGDELIRKRWRKLYDEDKIKEFKKEIEFAKKNFIEYGYILSPVSNISYSDEASFKKICKKYDQMFDLGIRSFGIFFDDIPEMLSPKDAQEFKEVASAHVYITNKVYEYLKDKDKNIKLVFCPIYYSGVKPSSYMKIVKERLNKEISIGWTGPNICSFEITSKQAEEFKEIAGVPPGIGDNFPVASSWGFGPLRNRSSDLYKHSTGYTANPMGPRPESSKISLITIADYSWNPDEYNPDESYENALILYGGEKVYKHLKIFCDHFSTSSCKFEKPPHLKILREKFWNDYIQNKEYKKKIDEILKEFKICEETNEFLKRNFHNEDFLQEMMPSLIKFENYGKTGTGIFNLLKTFERPKSKDKRNKIKDIVEKTLDEIIKEVLAPEDI